jgi:uncharacterized protein (DUF362 family)/Pyruvate/2-oxoacid:ferredoxin oxidoreductase delta subunit
MAFKVAGIEDIAKKYNTRLIAFESFYSKKIEDKKAKILRNITLTEFAFNVDLIVNLPKLKTHSLMKYTGAVKNLFGLVPGGIKQNYHMIADREDKFGNLLIDIYQNIKTPKINIMDGIIGLEGNGPGSGGNPIKTGYILASENAIALDILASMLIGYNAMDILTNKFAIERGLFDKKNYEVIGNFVKVNYKKPSTLALKFPSFIRRWFFNKTKSYPITITEKCTKCERCIKICPANALIMASYPLINKSKCISCYCCHENCPKSAIELRKSSKLIEVLVRIKEILRV